MAVVAEGASMCGGDADGGGKQASDVGMAVSRFGLGRDAGPERGSYLLKFHIELRPYGSVG